MALVVKEKIDVPEGVELKLEGSTVEVSGPKGKLTRTFVFPKLVLKVEGRKVLIEAYSKRRRDKAAVSTVKSHLQNMFKGITTGIVYKLRVVYSHFPMTVKVEGKRVLIKNFLGERAPRVAKIVGESNVDVSGDEVVVSGIDKEHVGQTAFNIEQATFVRHRDLRTFQDGCYIVGRA